MKNYGMNKFPFYKQSDYKDCGPTCLKIIAKYYNKVISLRQIRQFSETTREGSSLLGLSDAAEKSGFKSLGVKINLEKLNEAPLPCILHWNKNHFAVLYKVKKEQYYISDPAHGLINYKKEEFLKHWIGNNANEQTQEGIALLLEPTPKFYDIEFDKEKEGLGFSFLSKYVFKYKRFLINKLTRLMVLIN
jgi:ATP-binding cassette subfamily B protein